MDDAAFPEQDPRPDEDAWEAYLNFVRPILGASDETGLENAQLSELQSVVGASVPFEVGLLLVMGVPAGFPWRNWQNDPAGQLEEWNQQVASTLELDSSVLIDMPQLMPIYANVAVPVGVEDEPALSNASPLFRIDPSGVSLAGLDLADWLHKEFDVPLPWWPDNEPRDIKFWTERAG